MKKQPLLTQEPDQCPRCGNEIAPILQCRECRTVGCTNCLRPKEPDAACPICGAIMTVQLVEKHPPVQ